MYDTLSEGNDNENNKIGFDKKTATAVGNVTVYWA